MSGFRGTTRRRVLAGLGLALAAALPVRAAGIQAHALSAADKADIARVEAALNAITTLKARFIQANPNGSQITGTLFLWRPGRMRLQYDPPSKSYVVADGLTLNFWYGELEQRSTEPLGVSLADLILSDTITLSGEVTVTDVQRRPGTLEVTLVKTDDAGSGSLTLVFQDRPLALRQWRVLDATGKVTEVTLQNVETGIALEGSLFNFNPPGPRRHG